MKSPLVIVLFILNAAVIGFTAFMMFSPKQSPQSVASNPESASQASDAEAKTAAPAYLEEIYYPLETFNVNLNSPGGQRILKISIEFMLSNPETRDELEASKAQYRDLIINILSSKKFEEIDNAEGKKLLKDEMSETLNPFLKKGKITKVIFTDIIFN